MASFDWAHMRRVNTLSLCVGSFIFAVVSYSPLLGGLMLALGAWKYPAIERHLGLSPAYLDKFTLDERASQDANIRRGTQWSLGLLAAVHVACGLFVPTQPLSIPWFAWVFGMGAILVLVNAYELIKFRLGLSVETYEQFCLENVSMSTILALPFTLLVLFGTSFLLGIGV